MDKAIELAKTILQWEKYDDFVKEHGWGATYNGDKGTAESVVDELWDNTRDSMVELAHKILGE